MIVGIPTIGEAPQLGPLVEQVLAEDVDQVLLMVNRIGVQLTVPSSPRVARVDLYDESIYAEWNWAVRYARNSGSGVAVALLNDDIELARGALSAVVAGLRSVPRLVAVGFDYEHTDGYRLRFCTGTYRNHGIGGFAFVVDADRCPEVDEQFEWFGGDDDLMFSIAAQGGAMAVLEGAHVTHTAGTTSQHHGWIHEAVARDRQRFLEKWGSTW